MALPSSRPAPRNSPTLASAVALAVLSSRPLLKTFPLLPQSNALLLPPTMLLLLRRLLRRRLLLQVPSPAPLTLAASLVPPMPPSPRPLILLPRLLLLPLVCWKLLPLMPRSFLWMVACCTHPNRRILLVPLVRVSILPLLAALHCFWCRDCQYWQCGCPDGYCWWRGSCCGL